MAAMFSPDEAAKMILNRAERQLRRCYESSWPKKRELVLKYIAAGYRSVFELRNALLFKDHEIRTLLQELVETGKVMEDKIQPAGGRGRPVNIYRVKE